MCVHLSTVSARTSFTFSLLKWGYCLIVRTFWFLPHFSYLFISCLNSCFSTRTLRKGLLGIYITNVLKNKFRNTNIYAGSLFATAVKLDRPFEAHSPVSLLQENSRATSKTWHSHGEWWETERMRGEELKVEMQTVNAWEMRADKMPYFKLCLLNPKLIIALTSAKAISIVKHLHNIVN